MPPKISRRKRLTKRKGRRYEKKITSSNEEPETIDTCDKENPECADSIPDFHAIFLPEDSTPEATVSSMLHSDHTYFGMQDSGVQNYSKTPETSSCTTKYDTIYISSSTAITEEIVSTSELLNLVNKKVNAFLHRQWISKVEMEALHVMCLSPGTNKAVQRCVQFSSKGDVELFVHNQPVQIDPYLHHVQPFIPLAFDTVNEFVDRIITIVNNVRLMEICSGYDDMRYEKVWSDCPLGEREKEVYGEVRYVETFRSLKCSMLVECSKWRCAACCKLAIPLRRRAAAAATLEPKKFTKNILLSEDQKLNKLANLQREMSNTKKKLTRIQEHMQELIKKEAITIEENLSAVLSNILDNSDKVTPAQSIFLQQQVKASQQKNAVGMRWHPTMIRFALSIHLTSPAAYQLLRDTGMIKLPCTRTLFDYSHVKPAVEGIDGKVVEKLSEKVQELSNKINEKTGKKEDHKKFHVLMGDELYISQNLVFQKSSGKMIGFTSLDEVDAELKVLQAHLDNSDKEIERTIASKVMVYMVKGVTNGLKDVVATYAVGNMSAVQMKIWTWQVVGALERSGIAIVAFVCDGSSTNRAFIQSHKPASSHPSGTVFDTVNKCARHRKLFFLSDVPHLLKTIRNCFLNSRWDNKRSRRKMVKNNSRISWDYIVKLYESKRGKTLRKSFKLNPMNVFPDSYARMKVKYAGQVLSKTVSLDLLSQGWPEVKETALFIDKVNDWFDCLNGAHSAISKKKNKPNVAAYTSVSDPRFDLLDNFLSYLEEWEMEAKNHDVTTDTSCSNINGDNDESVIDEGGPPDEDDVHVSKRLLSRQTLKGIYMTTLAFRPLVTFMLEQGASFINARVFTQDPLEQHFSKLRAGQGGSTNPNLGQVLKRTNALELIGEMGMKRRKGNSAECAEIVKVTTEKLPKLKSRHIPKFMEL
ncbi:Transposable element P transposase [Frankliniella fusca]|uniref:Transposable element P transposase n=1 Tax=Frankliniella fusca TaxID=407009 RepID=A0AAE1GX57_9NEOP|nr:Transposable element P transposase [Frankliniella fusca]